MSKIFLRHTLTKKILDIFDSLSLYIFTIKVITKLPNSEQSYKGKVKTHNYINRQNQSTTGKQILLQWQPEPLNRNESERFGALKSDSTHHFFRNACTKSGWLRFSQFSGCWLILSVYIIMSFDFPFVRLFGVR
jgi:hypothetical protein